MLTQYKSQSLIRHIECGRSFPEASLGEYVDVVPAQQRVVQNRYSSTANADCHNLDNLCEARAEYALILAGDHVYKMDHGQMPADHVASRADAMVASLNVPLAQAASLAVVQVTNSRASASSTKSRCIRRPVRSARTMHWPAWAAMSSMRRF